MTYATQITACIKRLEKSDTPLKRKNARAAVRGLLRTIDRELDDKFPLLNTDGTEIKKPKRPTCPLCGVPQANWQKMLAHLQRRHAMRAWTCFCGKNFSQANSKRANEAIIRHIAAQPDLKAHIQEALVMNTLSSQGIPSPSQYEEPVF